MTMNAYLCTRKIMLPCEISRVPIQHRFAIRAVDLIRSWEVEVARHARLVVGDVRSAFGLDPIDGRHGGWCFPWWSSTRRRSLSLHEVILPVQT